MIKKLFSYTALLLAMTACSVDEIDTPSGIGPDGELTINLAVPEMETVITRADEFKVSDLTMLVLSNENVVKTMPFTLGDGLTETGTPKLYQLKCTLSPELRTKDNLSFYFIANRPSTIGNADLDGKSESQLLSTVKTTAYLNDNEYITMSGKLSYSDLQANRQVNLRRNVAKVTVRDGSQDADGNWTEGDLVYPVEVYSTNSSSSVVAGTIDGTNYIQDPSHLTTNSFTGKETAYVHATLNPGRDKETRPFMIIKAHYPTTSVSPDDEYFYRLEFENIDKQTGLLTPLNILPNHHYQVMIEDIKGKGDKSVEAAVKNPSSLVMATIYDYSPVSYNMITDGTRELGVSAQLIHNGNPTGGTPEYVYVKLYSKYGEETTNPEIRVESSNPRWLIPGTPEPYSGGIGTPIPDTGNFDGVIYRIPVEFVQTREPGNIKGSLTVTWKGLQRVVPVLWTHEFNASELCTVELTIYDNNGNDKFHTGYTSDDNYWTFIRDKSRINGLSIEQNNGKVRNEGLHFPVNYGGQGARWRYVYRVKFTDQINDGMPYDWRISTTGLTGITISPSTSGKNVTGSVEITITQDGSAANWNYEVGELKLEISKPDEEIYTPYTIDLYHTGFFDNPKLFREEDRRVDKTETDFFYYYEVIHGLTGDYYWLDRNLGATSAEDYIESEGGNLYFGRNNEPRGGYYKVAEYVEGGAPAMYTDLCPPGFEIPRVEVWNLLRNSADFLTNRDGTRYLTQFTNAKGQTVYFPRSMYYNSNGSKIGESRTGYYWTSTKSEGLEKDQIGNWLRYIKFSGSIASYDNAEVEGRQLSKGWAMSVRCVNVVQPSEVVHRTHFNVVGATHVFLYSETPGVDAEGNPTMIRNSVTNWPGIPIGNYSTMGNEDGTISGSQSFNFVYESPNTHPSDFYVMFTFRDINGIWHTMSKGDGEDETLYTTQARMSSLKGWKVIGDTWNGKTTALGGTWICDYNGTNANVSYSSGSYTPPIPPVPDLPDVLTIYYSDPSNFANDGRDNVVWLYAYKDGGEATNASWPGVKMTKENNLWKGEVDRTKYDRIIFNNGKNSDNGGRQTNNLTVEQENNFTYQNYQK